MVNVFLMGTVGDSRWREPFKKAFAQQGISFFDPRVATWTEADGRREAEELGRADIVVMAITPDTASIGALAESGWAALSAILRKQAFGLYIDPTVNDLDEPGIPGKGPSTALHPHPNDNLEEASARARKLTIDHATALHQEHPQADLYLARSLDDLLNWAVSTAQRLAARPRE
jgi:hypothetical protein